MGGTRITADFTSTIVITVAMKDDVHYDNDKNDVTHDDIDIGPGDTHDGVGCSTPAQLS